MIEIKEYAAQYAGEMSKIILDNMYTINVKDHGRDVIDKIAQYFTEEQIKKDFPNRTKCFVALEEDTVVGTASISKLHGDETDTRYIVLTVFVKLDRHHQGIGKQLMDAVEHFAKRIHAKELIVPASVYGCEFYRKRGYDYLNGIREQNEEKEYMLVKHL